MRKRGFKNTSKKVPAICKLYRAFQASQNPYFCGFILFGWFSPPISFTIGQVIFQLEGHLIFSVKYLNNTHHLFVKGISRMETYIVLNCAIFYPSLPVSQRGCIPPASTEYTSALWTAAGWQGQARVTQVQDQVQD